MKFRKKPVVIEAYQFGVGDPVPDWITEAWQLPAAEPGAIFNRELPIKSWDEAQAPWDSFRAAVGGVRHVHLHVGGRASGV